MKKNILTLLLFSAFIWFIGQASAYNCQTIYTRTDNFIDRYEDFSYRYEILSKTQASNEYEASLWFEKYYRLEAENKELTAENTVLQNELKWCESKDSEYKNYLAIWGNALVELDNSSTYKPELIEKAITNYEKALSVANEANTTHMNISWLKEQIANLKQYKATQDKILEEREANIRKAEAEQKAIEEAVEKEIKETKVKAAKKALWNKAAIFESLVPLFKAKDSKTQENVKALLKTFSQSNDEYTRNIGIYFWYLVE